MNAIAISAAPAVGPVRRMPSGSREATSGPRRRSVFLPCLGSLLLSSAAFSAAPIRDFPVNLRAGLVSSVEMRERLLPDLPFSLERGYGYIGGEARVETGKVTFGGEPSWPVAWREGMEGYVFRVPNGAYLLELTFLEAEAGAPGLRVFDVLAEGLPILSGLDLAKAAGDFVWVTLSSVVSVRDGWLDLKFQSASGSRPPVLSGLRLSRGRPEAPPPPPRLSAQGGLECVLLRWEIPEHSPVSGYGVFRAESPEGPFASLTPVPIPAPRFADAGVSPGETRYYKVRAYGPGREAGDFSDVVSAAPRAASECGLKVYRLRVSAERVRDLFEKSSPPREVQGELRYLDAAEPVRVQVDTSPERWQAKKSFWIEFERGRPRAFAGRRDLFLSAEAGDPTQLGELVRSAASRALGLAIPQVEPVLLFLNDRPLGLYFDLEIPDRRFRKRAGLDEFGLLARKTREDKLSLSWEPYGERVDEGGEVHELTEFVHELNYLGDGEIQAFFGSSLYLDRYLRRAALSALSGDERRGDTLGFWLRDSRNGRWEFLPVRGSSGAWGPATSCEEPRSHPADAARLVWGGSLLHGGGGSGGAGTFETRFFAQETLRVQFLRTLQEVLANELSPEAFRSLVDAEFQKVRRALVEDAFLWGGPEGLSSTEERPALLEAEFRARVGLLVAFLASDAARAPGELLLTEILALPESGAPWIEIYNASGREVELGDYCVSTAFGADASAGVEKLPARRLGSGDRAVVRLDRLRPSSPDGAQRFLGLYCVSGGEKAARVSDFVFFGRPARGRPYARLEDRGRWAYLDAPTPGTANAGRELQPPPWRFRYGIADRGSGELEIWFRTVPEPEGPHGSRPEKVSLRLRPEGVWDFEEREMPWDEKEYRFSARVKRDRGRIACYFVAVSADGIERAYPLPAPALTYFVPALPEVKINEVLARPAPGAAANSEFIEVYNPTETAVDLGGYFLTDSRRNPMRWRIPSGTTVPPKGFLVFYADGRDRGNHTSFRLSNAGEYVGLYGRREEGNLLVDALVYRALRASESWGALPDGTKNFRAWRDPTPGAKNVPKIPQEYLERKAKERDSGKEPPLEETGETQEAGEPEETWGAEAFEEPEEEMGP